MKPTANVGAETPLSSTAGGLSLGDADIDPDETAYPGAEDHDPDAKALLRRYLAEVYSFREMGNQALRNLEARLAGIPTEEAGDAHDAHPPLPQPVTRPASQLVVPSLAPSVGKGNPPDPSLKQRLNELSAYLHADLSRGVVEQDEASATERPESPLLQPQSVVQQQSGPRTQASQQAKRATLRQQVWTRPQTAQQAPRQPAPQPQSRPQAQAAQQLRLGKPAQPQQPSQSQHKIPTAPVLDRAWFEERFAALRSSIDRLAQDTPLARIELLEAQFRDLMDRLAAREDARDPRPMEASLKELASYLADSKQWQASNDQRMRGVEDRLDRLSALVAKSNAAIAATAKGLEVVAKGTGDTLARTAAGMAKLSEKIDRTATNERLDEFGRQVAKLAQTNPADRLEQLGREVAHLTAQSRIVSRSTDDRLGQIEIAIKEKAKPAPPPARAGRPSAPLQPQDKSDVSECSSRDELESYLNRQPNDANDDYDREMIAAAQRAARLADGGTRNAPSRNGMARYQIPYGDFLPEDDSSAPRAGLVLAVVILLLAGAVMLFLKAKEWTLNEPKPAALLEHPSSEASSVTLQQNRRPSVVVTIDSREGSSANPTTGVPVVTGSTPAAPPLGAKPLQLWVAAKTPDAAPTTTPVSKRETESSFRQAAVQGDAKAQFSVGQSYLSGANVDPDLSEGDRLTAAARWFRRAAEAGHAPSQYRLARLYELGRGAPRDLAEAEKWYDLAAAQGHVHAMHSLAMLSASQNRRSVNYLTAAKWFAEAASYGLIESQFNLGILCENGLGLPKNLNDAYFWFAVGARQKDARSAQKRDEIGKLLSPSEREKADRRAAVWTPKPKSEEINRLAPEPPVALQDDGKPVPPPAPAPLANTAVMRPNWKTDVASTVKASGSAQMFAEAQRLLTQMGYQPGPIDGVPGPRTQAAIRSYQRRAGLEVTGQVSEALIVKMAFLPL